MLFCRRGAATKTNEVRAFVYHGSASGLSATASWTTEGNKAGAYYGCSVATAGDVNGDGYSDVIVGAFAFMLGLDIEGMAFVYHGSASGLSVGADWTAESNPVDARFGHSVATAGDVNGDGYSDVIAGAPRYDAGQTDEGRAFVYYGNGGGGLTVRPEQLRADDASPSRPSAPRTRPTPSAWRRWVAHRWAAAGSSSNGRSSRLAC